MMPSEVASGSNRRGPVETEENEKDRNEERKDKSHDALMKVVNKLRRSMKGQGGGAPRSPLRKWLRLLKPLVVMTAVG